MRTGGSSAQFLLLFILSSFIALYQTHEFQKTIAGVDTNQKESEAATAMHGIAGDSTDTVDYVNSNEVAQFFRRTDLAGAQWGVDSRLTRQAEWLGIANLLRQLLVLESRVHVGVQMALCREMNKHATLM
jgi:hypothetical protein